MILLSTRIKLAQSGKPAYRVSYPEFVVQGMTVPASFEDFANKITAQTACKRWLPHAEGTVREIEPIAGFLG